MFVEDYRELKIQNAEEIAARCFLFEKFVADLLAKEPESLRFKHESGSRGILIHPHCHVRKLMSPNKSGECSLNETTIAKTVPTISHAIADV